ncbi:Hypothetical predicted protein [Podarcis lilfordi]|uniref:Uncharacterized protein n=1 Tax=Podarcis lilfordi TaxID=74358 RepID=A0AA35K0H8_9SAUR|nr:Hypothetical predicted protein [Podarcis lilfordi]
MHVSPLQPATLGGVWDAVKKSSASLSLRTSASLLIDAEGGRREGNARLRQMVSRAGESRTPSFSSPNRIIRLIEEMRSVH